MTQPATKRLVSEARLNDAVAAAVAAPTDPAIAAAINGTGTATQVAGDARWQKNLTVFAVAPATNVSATDTANVQGAINAAAAAGGGMVQLGRGQYRISTTLTLPVGQMISIVGAGHGTVGDVYGTELVRASSLSGSPIISALGTGSTASTRVRFRLANLDIHGNGGTGTLLQLQRINDSTIENVRLSYTTGTLLQASEWWNCTLHRVFFQNGGANGRTTPAVLLDSVPTTGGSGNTIQFTACEWEANVGTDLRITGNAVTHPSGQDWTVAALFTNIKMERNSGDFPLIDLDRAGACQFSDGFFHLGPLCTAPHVEQKGTAVTPNRPNGFSNCEFSGSKWDGVGESGAAVVPCFVDVTVGQMLLSNVSMNGAPTTAFIHAGPSLASGAVRLSNVVTTARDKLIYDERPGSNYGKGTIQLTPAVSDVAPTLSVNRAVYVLPDVSTSKITFQNVTTPNDASAAMTPTLRIWWYSDVATGVVRWDVATRRMDSTDPTITTAATTQPVTTTVPATSNTLTSTTVALTQTVSAGQLLSIYLARLGSDASDTCTGAARVLAVELLYLKSM